MLALQFSCKATSKKKKRSVVNLHFPVQGGHNTETGSGGQTICRAEGAG